MPSTTLRSNATGSSPAPAFLLVARELTGWVEGHPADIRCSRAD
ncbi:hypothetical protein [Amycolatopsis dongchuanensis]